MFIVFSKEGCPYCDKALEFIREDLQSTANVYDVTEYPATHRSIMNQTGQDTVPAIYVGPHFVGGCDDLIESHENGKLRLFMLEEENRLLKIQIERLRSGPR